MNGTSSVFRLEDRSAPARTQTQSQTQSQGQSHHQAPGAGSSTAPKIWALIFDLPGEKVNKLSRAVMDAFDPILTRLEGMGARHEIDALMLVSGKPGAFVAGADIEMIQSAHTSTEAAALSQTGHGFLNRWEDLPFPTVAVIDGAALGGGCEFALASTAIVMSNSSSAKIGLPEVMLGLIPGMGGCVRLPRKVGLATSLDLILTGKALSGERAFRAGLVEACLPKEDFEHSAQRWVVANLAALREGRRLAKEPKLGGMGGPVGAVLERTPPGRKLIMSKARDGVLKKTRGVYPSPLEALRVLGDNGAAYGPRLRGRARDEALRREAEGFGRVAATAESKHLIRLFFLTEMVKKSTGVAGNPAAAHDVSSVGVLGAGVMGGGIAQLLADKSIAVRMKDLNTAALAAGIAAATKIFQSQLRKKRLTSRGLVQKLNHIGPSLDYTGFAGTQLVIEAIVEKMEIKQRALAEVEAQVGPGCVLASNTSSLSITEMQRALKDPRRFVGMHFFNPVHRMPLVEVIRGAESSDEAVSTVFQLSKKLGKTPIVVKDAPGFLVNRLLMPYLNEATWLLAEGVPIDEIDEALLDFGMPMGPIEVIDEVGVDVADKVAHILQAAFGARVSSPPLNQRVVEAGRLGKKNGAGFYKWEKDGRAKLLDPAIYGVVEITPKARQVSREEIVERCLLPMINEAARCLAESVVGSAEELDLGVIMGTGFPPFRGGLLSYADTLGARAVVDRLRVYEARFGQRFEPSAPLLERAQSGTPFRRG